ncbi:translocation/assembly module TamB domain-containing protein [Alcaligenes sp. SORT26]|uniref:translocation/assembly module TamB domain-containing protein n=1 Tax=Alcaligenes sp. SORT26 TaxID=2813780 RepID=UPI001A9DA047|nr:translocation/assembly module TamB domain-containing protein [Alcaligenes sp. SORT26]QTB99517.1 translocation/assembly module TamB domain-containing protein [Alcaligenes sp. SORT26]
MAWVRRWFRYFALWGIPFVVVALLLVCGFVYWVLASQAGTSWALRTALPYAQGSAQGVRGTIWDGLSVDHLVLGLPGTHVDIERLRLQANWKELWERRLHVIELSAHKVDVALTSSDEPKSDEPFKMPELPVSIAVDKLALGQFLLTQDGTPLPVAIADLSSALALDSDSAQLRLYDLIVANESIRAGFQGEVELGGLEAPYPARADIQIIARGLTADSPICAKQYLPAYAEQSTSGKSATKAVAGQPKTVAETVKTSAKADASGGTSAAAATSNQTADKASEKNSGKTPGKSAEQSAEPAEAGATLQGQSGLKAQSQAVNSLEQPIDPHGVAGVISSEPESSTGVVDEGRIQEPVVVPEPEPLPDCVVNAQITLNGSLEQATLLLNGHGQGYSLDASAELSPLDSVPVRQAKLAVKLPDESSLDADFAWDATQEGVHVQDHFKGQFRSDKLDLHALLGDVLPDALINTQGQFDVVLADKEQLLSADVDIQLLQGSRWNKQTAIGQIKAKASAPAQPGQPDWWRLLTVSDVLTDMKIGENQVQLKGGFGMSGKAELDLLAKIPRAEQLWPGLELGKASAQGQLRGEIARHTLQLKGQYDLGGNAKGQLGQGLAEADLALEGGWHFADQGKAAYWDGKVNRLVADHAGLIVRLQSALPVRFTDALRAPEPPAQAAKADAKDQAKPADAATAAPEKEVAAQTSGSAATQSPSAEAPMPATAQTAASAAPAEAEQAKAQAGAPENAADKTATAPKTPEPLAPWSVRVGAGTLSTTVDGEPWINLRHQESSYQPGQWASRGELLDLVLSEPRIARLLRKVGVEASAEKDKGGVKIVKHKKTQPPEIDIKARWDLKFNGALSGQVRVDRVAGDVQVFAEPPMSLGLEDLSIVINAKPTSATTSRVDAQLDLRTKEMGYVTAKAQTPIHGLALNENDRKTVSIQANIDDLSWTRLFLGDAMELGGRLNADVNIDVGAKWAWTSRGTVTGRELRFTRLDDGIRLIDGQLDARFDGDIFRLESLSFPARPRVEPQEWRTATWLKESPDAKDGKLTVSGQWNLSTQQGAFGVDIFRFPILQRADRYAMMSGNIALNMELPRIAITGKVEADAGWFNLDMLGGIPTVDSDVVIVRAGDEPASEPSQAATDMSMEIDVDLGPRFYLTGYGVNSGLVGSLRVTMIGGKLTGMGALRTRGGRIELYGQKLMLKRGTVTFQGDITSPILDIEALRTGQAVEAGVKVAGTARKPRIDLVSYPEVSEVEKLSWLLLGHGPDDSGGDMALLLSVGTSFLGDGEPFYRKFGIDEVAMRSGDLGSAGSILPVESVVKSLNSGTSNEERKFIAISKALTADISVSLEQAMADTGTVGRASYRLARGLTAEVSAGTVNGLALIYRWFSKD